MSPAPAPLLVAHAARQAAARAGSLADLGGELARQLHRLVPHDGYMLSGKDPVTGVGCFLIEHQGYSCAHFRRIKAAGLLDQQPVRQDMTAREAEGAERELWWSRAVEVWPDYAGYQTKTDRVIPVFVLEPTAGANGS